MEDLRVHFQLYIDGCDTPFLQMYIMQYVDISCLAEFILHCAMYVVHLQQFQTIKLLFLWDTYPTIPYLESFHQSASSFINRSPNISPSSPRSHGISMTRWRKRTSRSRRHSGEYITLVKGIILTGEVIVSRIKTQKICSFYWRRRRMFAKTMITSWTYMSQWDARRAGHLSG